MYVRIFILRICARRRRCLNEAFLVKIANSNFKQMTPAIASVTSERSIFSKNHDYNSYINSFPCRAGHVRTYWLHPTQKCLPRCTRSEVWLAPIPHPHSLRLWVQVHHRSLSLVPQRRFSLIETQ